MRFVIDGDEPVSYIMTYDLLRDIGSLHIFDGIEFVSLMPQGFAFVSDEMTRNVNMVLRDLEDKGFSTWTRTSDVQEELAKPDTVFIVIGAETRPELVNYCHDNGIEVLDLTKALYPV